MRQRSVPTLAARSKHNVLNSNSLVLRGIREVVVEGVQPHEDVQEKVGGVGVAGERQTPSGDEVRVLHLVGQCVHNAFLAEGTGEVGLRLPAEPSTSAKTK